MAGKRPDLILENKKEKRIWIADMARDNGEKYVKKLRKYQQLAFETR